MDDTERIQEQDKRTTTRVTKISRSRPTLAIASWWVRRARSRTSFLTCRSSGLTRSLWTSKTSGHVSLQAEVLELLKLDVGADVQLGKVDLDIKGLAAQALLKVRLDRVAAIVGRVLTTIDRNRRSWSR